MNGKAYRFATSAQWRSCLVSGADMTTALTPLARYASLPSAALPSDGAQVPALASGTEVLWRDDADRLHRAMIDDGVDEALLAPFELAHTPRIVANAGVLFAIDADHAAVALFDRDTLTRITRTETLGDRMLDLAADCRGVALALCERDGGFGFVRVRCDGTHAAFHAIAHVGTPVGFASLPKRRRTLVLSDSGTVAHLFEGEAGKPATTIALGSLRPCFRALAIASDGHARWLLAGRDGADFGGAPAVLVLDADGELIDVITLPTMPTGIAASVSALLVAHADGVHVHRLAAAGDTPSTGTMQVITPVLHAPDTTTASRWSRAQASVVLPPGTSAEVRIAAIGDPVRIDALLRDKTLSQRRKREALAQAVQWSTPIALQGHDAAAPVLLAAPMHDIALADALVRVDLRAAPNTALPRLHSLEVSYGDAGLAERMPMIYRRQMETPGDFLRALVGVLDTTSQESDARIAMLGALIDPRTAPAEWLDQVARWLGLPWDDALDLDRKRCLVRHAGALSSLRGTREGLDTLLRCLLPSDDGPRHRIVDVDVDIGFARLGGDHCLGSRLPALLTGLPRNASVLSRRACLGTMRLPCAGQGTDDAATWRRMLRIEIVADALERARMQPWLAAMVAAMVPATARVRLHWRWPGMQRDTLDDSTFVLTGDARTRLGVDAVAGRARLPAFRSSTLG